VAGSSNCSVRSLPGYTWALRNYVVDQQEEVKRALSQAWQNVERDLRASEARFREVFDSSPVVSRSASSAG
jgi:hypothetical protein